MMVKSSVLSGGFAMGGRSFPWQAGGGVADVYFLDLFKTDVGLWVIEGGWAGIPVEPLCVTSWHSGVFRRGPGLQKN
jgi:hypothetical protein